MPRATAQVWTLLVALSAALDAPSAAAPAPPALRVDVTGCPATRSRPTCRRSQAWKSDVLLHERGPNQGPPDSVAVLCTESTAHIEVTLAGARRTSTMELGALAADHRARAIALATAELVGALSGWPAAPASPVNPPPSAPAGKPPAASETTPEATPRWARPRPPSEAPRVRPPGERRAGPRSSSARSPSGSESRGRRCSARASRSTVRSAPS